MSSPVTHNPMERYAEGYYGGSFNQGQQPFLESFGSTIPTQQTGAPSPYINQFQGQQHFAQGPGQTNPFNYLDQIQRSTNPLGFGRSYLDMLGNNNALAGAVNAGGFNGVAAGAERMMTDLFGGGAFNQNSWDPNAYKQQMGMNIPQTGSGVAATPQQALAGVRDVTLADDPLGRTQLQNQFLGNPMAQGAVSGLRDRSLGNSFNVTANQSSFNRMGDNERNRFAGRAAAFGRDTDQVRRGVLRNTLSGRGDTVRSGYGRG